LRVVVPRTAIVLAAGEGKRLGGRKIFVKVQGRPLIWYPLTVLHLIGVSEFFIVTRREYISDLSRVVASITGPNAFNIIVNEEAWRENGHSLVLGLKRLGLRHAFVSMSDHVYSPIIPMRVAAGYHGWEAYSVACDATPDYVDVDEATKVSAIPPLLHSVGKELKSWLCIDAGVHAVHDTWYMVNEALSAYKGGVLKLNTLVRHVASKKVVRVEIFKGIPWTEIDTPRDLEEAEKGVRRGVVDHVISWARR
jgi:choline kinase